MKRVLNFIGKGAPFNFGHLPMYFYLVRAYSKFLIIGKCLDFPLKLQIQTQSFCNGRCSMCPYPTLSKKLDQGQMQWELYKKIVDELAAEPLLSGVVYELHNEPLLDKRLFSWIKYFKSISKNKKCILITNGQLLDKFSLTDIKESDIDIIMVSLNAYSKETYQLVNEGLDYDKVMKNINYLLSDNYMKERLALSFAVTDKNMHEVSQVVQHWHQMGVRTRVMGITNRAGTLKNYEEIRSKEIYRIIPPLSGRWRRLMSHIEKNITGCHLPFCHMNILFNGDVIICCHDWARTTVVGNVRTSSLKEIWNSKKMNRIRRLILKKRYEQIDSCRGCSLVGRQ